MVISITSMIYNKNVHKMKYRRVLALNIKTKSRHNADIIGASRVSASANGPPWSGDVGLIFFHVKYVIKPITFGKCRLPGSAAVYHLPRGILPWRIIGLLTLGNYPCASITRFLLEP